MTLQRNGYEDVLSTLRYVGRLDFQPLENDHKRFRSVLPEGRFAGLRLLVRFDGKDYPFLQHYVFGRHRENEPAYTFSNMEFNRDPPGERVGPWPGWRGIPRFPVVTLCAGGSEVPVTMMPWGDELSSSAIRGGATFESSPSGELICTTSDSRLRPVDADLYVCRLNKAVPRKITLLPELAGTHPRLLVTRADIPLLRQKAFESHRSHWARITSLRDNWDLPWEITPESKVLPGPERLRGEDRALIAAITAMVDPSPPHSTLARNSLLEYLHETQQPQFQPLTIDTQTGETLFILALCFDWTNDQWSVDERADIQNWLWKVADICWSYLGYERRDYGQAHYLGCAMGLLAFSFLFWEEHPRAQEWAAHCRGVIDRLIELLPHDGFYPHGINLWIYEYGFLLRWLELMRVCTGTDLWHATGNWKNASAFRAASTSPDGRCGITFGDPQYRVGGDSWCHYLIAARTHSPHAQSLGDALLEAPVPGIDFRHAPPRRRVYEFLYYGEDLPAQQSSEQVQVFQDGGQLFVRQQGIHPSVFTFRAGPPLGQQRYLAGEFGGYGHADPANGSFLLYVGDRFAITGPGPTYRRDTSSHNTITIDRQGQIGDSTVWLPDFIPPDVLCPAARFRIHNGHVSISAPLTPTYLPHLGVDQCHRAMWIDPGRSIIGVDTVRCRNRCSIEWNLHIPLNPALEKEENPIAFNLGDGSYFLRLVLLDPPNPHTETGVTEMVPAYPHDGNRTTYLQFSVRQTDARFVWCLLLDAGTPIPQSTGEDGNLKITVHEKLNLVYQDGFLFQEERYDDPS